MLAGTASFANTNVDSKTEPITKPKTETSKTSKEENDRCKCCNASGGGTSVTVCCGGNECQRALDAWWVAQG